MTDFDEQRERVAIGHLLSTYSTSGERGKIDAITALWSEDGVLTLPTVTARGKEEIGRVLGGVAGGENNGPDLRGSRIHLTTTHIEFDDDRNSRGWIYFIVMRGATILQSGLYVDTYRRAGSEWKITSRRAKLSS